MRDEDAPPARFGRSANFSTREAWLNLASVAELPRRRDSTVVVGSAGPATDVHHTHDPAVAEFVRAAPRAGEVLAKAAMEYARRGWPVLPGSAWNGRRFVAGSGMITRGLRPTVPRTFASSDPLQVSRWWGSDQEREPSVLLGVGGAFDVVSVDADAAAELLFTRAFQSDGGPVMFQPHVRKAQCFLTPGATRQLKTVAAPAIRPWPPGSRIAAPPSTGGQRCAGRLVVPSGTVGMAADDCRFLPGGPVRGDVSASRTMIGATAIRRRAAKRTKNPGGSARSVPTGVVENSISQVQSPPKIIVTPSCFTSSCADVRGDRCRTEMVGFGGEKNWTSSWLVGGQKFY